MAQLIGLTGSIATGKSTVARVLRDHGAAILDADVLAREVVAPTEPALEKIRTRFGNEVIENGQLNRERLGRIIFSDAQARADLNHITHPAVRARAEARFKAFTDAGARLVYYDIPLLFETSSEAMFEKIIVVYLSPTLQKERLMERNGLSDDEALNRIGSQQSIEAKARRADYVIDNSGTPKRTQRVVERLHQSLLTRAGG